MSAKGEEDSIEDDGDSVVQDTLSKDVGIEIEVHTELLEDGQNSHRIRSAGKSVRRAKRAQKRT